VGLLRFGFPPDRARSWTRYAFGCRWGEGRSRRRPRLPEFVFAGYGAIGHLQAALLTVNLELWASSEKVTRVASIQVLVATELPRAQVVFVLLGLSRVSYPQT
jgi:hypothetical protein